ncbi:MAG: class B sortase [Eubacteriales bacterium]|jgi:SrtB family sortase|nr:class B sortase [Eubacteriales bacterium]
MKRKKRRSRSKADIITGVLYGILGLFALAALYGIGRGAYALMGATVGNHYYASLAEKAAPAETVDFARLTQENPEVRGWVRLADTAIDLPLVKTTDNDFYLNHRFDEKRNKLGTPFIDAGNAGDFSDRHTVVYGHALSSGAMFGSLWEYENPNYFMRRPEIQLFLPDGTQRTLAVFACSRVDGVRSAIPIAFSSETAFLSFIDELLAGSAFSSNVKIAASDRIVSFCVALPDGGEGRLLVSCKIMESSGVTTIGDLTTLSPVETTQEPEESPQG